MTRRRLATWGVVLMAAGALMGQLGAQETGHHAPSLATSSQKPSKPPVHITMEELHQHGGVPPGWSFSFPSGDPQAGRAIFANLECYQCHTIQGESFPPSSSQERASGPELTGMGSHHPAEYFAESILNPQAVVVLGPGYTDAAGLSIMPEYRDSLTVDELIDLVAYVKSLGGEHEHAGMAGHHGGEGLAGHRALLDTVVGPYRVRVVYHESQGSGHHHSAPSASEPKPQGQNHFMAFVTDRTTGTDVPYLPVSATIHPSAGAPRTVQLMPMVAGAGFHYGADVTLPPKHTKVTIAIGATTIRVMPSMAGRFSKPETVSFDWVPQPSGPSRTGAQHHPSHGKPGTEHGH
jgi:mono/diheme cytochrome c family protein